MQLTRRSKRIDVAAIDIKRLAKLLDGLVIFCGAEAQAVGPRRLGGEGARGHMRIDMTPLQLVESKSRRRQAEPKLQTDRHEGEFVAERKDCLHPPGGAAALTAVLGGPAVFTLGYKFAFVPVGLNSALLVFCGFLFHRLSRRHVYPHVASRALAAETPSPDRLGFRAADIDKAIEELGETLDVDRGDIDLLLRRVELHALSRAHGHLTCEDIMTRNVHCISWDTSPEAAQRLLLAHSQPILPIIDDREKVIGCVTLSELLRFGGHITTLMSEAATAQRETPAVDLIDELVDGKLLGVVIVDANQRLKGLVTQADLLAALSRIR